jgi:hypothetical protein
MLQSLTRNVCNAVVGFGILLALSSTNQLFAQVKAPTMPTTKKTLTKIQDVETPNGNCPGEKVQTMQCPRVRPDHTSKAKDATLKCEFGVEGPIIYTIKIDCECNAYGRKPSTSCFEVLGEGCKYEFEGATATFGQLAFNDARSCQTHLNEFRDDLLDHAKGLCIAECARKDAEASKNKEVKCCTAPLIKTNGLVSP